jgi:predicted ATPase
MPSPFKDAPKSILGSSSFFKLADGKRDRSLGDDPLSLQVLPLGSLRWAVDAVRFLDIQPSAMREYGRLGAPLGNEGKNFSGVLATLSDDPIVKHSFVAWLREFCAPEIEDLDFVEVEKLGDVMAFFVEKGGAQISARSVSDGTLRFMGILLALQTANAGDIFLIEEIGEGLHPTRIQFLLELLESAALYRNIQVIATSHSPVVLQWLTPERLREVIVFGRIPGRSGSVVRRLGKIPYFEEVIQLEGIEELFSTGWMETAL